MLKESCVRLYYAFALIGAVRIRCKNLRLERSVPGYHQPNDNWDKGYRRRKCIRIEGNWQEMMTWKGSYSVMLRRIGDIGQSQNCRSRLNRKPKLRTPAHKMLSFKYRL